MWVVRYSVGDLDVLKFLLINKFEKKIIPRTAKDVKPPNLWLNIVPSNAMVDPPRIVSIV